MFSGDGDGGGGVVNNISSIQQSDKNAQIRIKISYLIYKSNNIKLIVTMTMMRLLEITIAYILQLIDINLRNVWRRKSSVLFFFFRTISMPTTATDYKRVKLNVKLYYFER